MSGPRRGSEAARAGRGPRRRRSRATRTPAGREAHGERASRSGREERSTRAARRPGLLLAALAFAAAAAGCAERPNVVLLFVDTLRADRLRTYGGPRPVAPNVERLFARGAVFEDALAPAPWTLPSAASMLTGLHPRRHGAGLTGAHRNLDTDAPRGIVTDAETLATRLADAGYRCEAFTSNPYLEGGLERGFHQFSFRNTEGGEIVSRALNTLDRMERERPFFALLHFMDVHDPLLVPAEDLVAVTEPGDETRLPPVWARTFLGHDKIGVERYRAMRLLAYDGAIRYVDARIGRFLGELDGRGLLDDTLVVFTSDHGEEVYDHLSEQRARGVPDPRGMLGVGHGHSLFREQLWVPLGFTGPGIPARRVPDRVTLMDVLPTVLDVVGLPVPGGLDGRSLRPLWEGGALEPRPLLAGHLAYGPDRRAWITERWKLVVGPDGAEGEPPRLYDLDADPEERRDVAAEHPDVVRRLRDELRAAEGSLGLRRGPPAPISDEHRLDLQALGYGGGE